MRRYTEIFFVPLTLVTLACVSLGAKLPPDVEKCNYEDSVCISRTINYMLEKHFNGIPASNLISLDPVYVEKVDIIQGSESPVNVQLKLKELRVFGLKGARVESVKGFTQVFDGATSEIRAFVPHVQLRGQYTINGRVLVLPIQGEGLANITMTDLRAVIKVLSRKVEHKGSEYMQTDRVKISMDPQRMYMHLDNLYRGDPRLGPSTNLFLNENWQDIYRELRPSIEDTIAQVFKGIINNFFAKTKYHTLFLNGISA